MSSWSRLSSACSTALLDAFPITVVNKKMMTQQEFPFDRQCSGYSRNLGSLRQGNKRCVTGRAIAAHESMAVASVVDADEMVCWADSCSSRHRPYWRDRAPMVCAATQTVRFYLPLNGFKSPRSLWFVSESSAPKSERFSQHCSVVETCE